MEMTTHSSSKIKVLSIEGEMNANTSGAVDERLHKLIMGGNNKLVIDLSGLNYISSAGLRIFLKANKLIKKKQGEIRICGLNETVKEVFEISGFQMILAIFENQAKALADF
jgi:anti-sigma B factor antagonist